MRFTIDWASLIVGSKFTVFALFYFVFEGNFPSTSPQGAYVWTGLGGLYLEGLIFRILRHPYTKNANAKNITHKRGLVMKFVRLTQSCIRAIM